MKPLCFVLMPFGIKRTVSGIEINFDETYSRYVAPAVLAAGMEPLRADEEKFGGVIHKPMFERLILCDFAVADLTTANANVFYELGVRHAIKSWSTVLIYADGTGRLPFDVAPLRALPYQIDANGAITNPDGSIDSLVQRLNAAKTATIDSPLFQLVDGFPDIQRLKTDVFRERVHYSESKKRELSKARRLGIEAVKDVEATFGNLADIDGAIAVDLVLSYRAVKGWQDMIRVSGMIPPHIANSVLVQEQLALALNRAGESNEAEEIIQSLLQRRGPSSESLGILGRIYKDRWERANSRGENLEAGAFLERAIDAYLRGFESDWRDAYPGINALTLMEIKKEIDSRQSDLLPVVAFSVKRRIEGGHADYWDYATLVELAVLQKTQEQAEAALGQALTHIREKWEPETTARNLRLIREARARRGESFTWAEIIEEKLVSRSTLPL